MISTRAEGDAAAGMTVTVLVVQLADGTRRARIALEGEESRVAGSAPSPKGTDNSLPDEPQAMALVSHFEMTTATRACTSGAPRTTPRAAAGRDRAGTDSQVFVVRKDLRCGAARLESEEVARGGECARARARSGGAGRRDAPRALGEHVGR